MRAIQSSESELTEWALSRTPDSMLIELLRDSSDSRVNLEDAGMLQPDVCQGTVRSFDSRSWLGP